MSLRLVLVSLILSGLSLVSCTQNKDDSKKEDAKILTGKKEIFYENGGLKEVNHWENGKKEGEFKTYYENGNLESIGKYKADKLIDTVKFFFQNGNLMELHVYDLEGEIRSLRKYDKTSALTTNMALPKFSYESNVVDIGEDFILKIDFRNMLHDSLNVVVGKLDDEERFVNDTVSVLNCREKICYYSVNQSSSGEYQVLGTADDIRIDDEGVIHHQVVPFKITYYVRK